MRSTLPVGKGIAVGAGSWLFPSTAEGKTVKNRIHFDWMPTERTRDDEVQRIISLGATLYEDHRRADGPGWVTLLDPEGNEFCVERSTGERGLLPQRGEGEEPRVPDP